MSDCNNNRFICILIVRIRYSYKTQKMEKKIDDEVEHEFQ